MTKKGQAIVSDHSKDYDAQAVWKKLIAYHTMSPKAAAMKQKFLDQITLLGLIKMPNWKMKYFG